MSMSLYLKHASRRDLVRYSRDGVEGEDLGALLEAGFAEGQAARLKKQALFCVAGDGDTAFSPAAQDMVREHLELRRRRGLGRMRVSSPSAPVLDLHESWRMLHYLFAGDAFEGALPAATLLAGGREVGEDLGYGAPRMLSVEETASFAQFLRGLDLETLDARLDAGALKSLGTNDPARGGAEKLRKELARCFPQLRDFVAAAAARRQGMLIWML